jgi:protocatechuate 3,4-dioxygenase beta subunit
MRKFSNLLIVGLTMLTLQIVCMAQSSTHGSLTGTITDQQGAVVSGATVTLSTAVAGADRTAITDSNGNFDFQSFLPGTYTASVEAQGKVIGVTFAVLADDSSSNFVAGIQGALEQLQRAGWTNPMTADCACAFGHA